MKSSLTDITILNNHYSSRNGTKIDKITIHHMAGNLSAETCGRVFQQREASANYGIGSDGRIGCYVLEENRAWSTANPVNDRRAINIEVANDVIGGNWHVSDKALESCINLCVDICKRYGFKLVYDGTPNGSLTRHNMFRNTTCPGAYLQSKFEYIANEVNKRLETPVQPTKKSNEEVAREVINGLWGNGQDRKNRLIAAGYNPTTIQNIVNNILQGSNNKKSIDEIAREVIKGKWGNGQDRKNKLRQAGYNPDEVQKRVNELL